MRKVKCFECDEVHDVDEVNNDSIRFHNSDGDIVVIRDEYTQEQIDSVRLWCECCWEDIEEKGFLPN
jgi:hypothetical protein